MLWSFDSVTGNGGSKVAHSHIQGLGAGCQLGLPSMRPVTTSHPAQVFLHGVGCYKRTGEEAASLGNRAHPIPFLLHSVS